MRFVHARVHARGEAPGFILILGHMRSGSTLLNHILLTNPACTGYGESNLCYADRDDLAQLLWTSYRNRHHLGARRFAVDQVNHNYMIESADLLQAPDVRCIFLVRSPEPTIASIVEAMPDAYGDPRVAVTYYKQRLAALAGYSALLGNRAAAVVTYESLVANPEPVLADLTHALQLSVPLTPDYRSFGFTGNRGDRSANIRAGRVVRTSIRPRIALSPETLTALQVQYAGCLATLRQQVTGAPGPG